MNIFKESKDVSKWLAHKLSGIEIPSHNRSRVSSGCFDVSMEHQISVTLLAEQRLFGSAFALARCAFESYVRGVWLKYCATDKDINNFLRGKFFLRFEKLIDDIESCDQSLGKTLSTVKNDGWKVLNDFTHTGSRQVVRRHTETHVQSSYPEDEVIDILDFVNGISLLAGYEAYSLSKLVEDSEAESFLNRINEYKDNLRKIRPNQPTS